MKNMSRRMANIFLVVLLATLWVAVNVSFANTAAVQSGGSFTIKPSVIAGGGGTSTNGTTSLSGTIGQSVLGTSSGGSFTLNGGFWQSQPASSINITGQITYCAAASPPGAPITTVGLSGDVTMSTSTDASGNYGFNNLAPSSYTVTPSKTGAVSGINTTDVSRILQFLASGTGLTACQQLAADTSQNGLINTTDVSNLLNFLAGNPPTANNHTGEWRFNPTSFSHISVTANQTDNFSAILLGEVSGNWTPAGPEPGGAPPGGGQKAAPNLPLAVAVTLPTASVGTSLTTFQLPITISDTTGQKIDGFRMRIVYDPAVVTLTGVDSSGTLSSGFSFATNPTAGAMTVAAAGASSSPLTGAGTLLRLNFTRVGGQGTSTSLQFQSQGVFPGLEFTDSLDDTIVASTPVSGSITIDASPTAVNLEGFTASAYDGGVHIKWQAGYESHNLGFNVYREEDGKRTLINPQLIAGSALLAGTDIALKSGRAYGWWDAGGPGAARAQYWLEDVDLNGQSAWHGPIAAQWVGGAPADQTDAALLSHIGSAPAPAGAGTAVERHAAARLSAGQAAIQGGSIDARAVKVSVRREGWYRLSLSQLVAAGLSPKPNPDFLQMYVDGQPVPINVITDDHKQLTAIEFYGTGVEAAYTDTRAYWVAEGQAPGLRIAQVKVDAPLAAAHNFNSTVERRDRSIYFAGVKNGERENFFGAVIGRDAVTETIALPHVDRAAPSAQVEVSLQGVSALPHRVWAYVNGSFAGEMQFNGQELKAASFALSPSLLKEGDNEVQFAAQGGPLDISLVDYVRFTYPRAFTADADQLRLTANGGEAVTVDGFSSAAIRVLDVTDPDRVQQLAGKIEPGKTGYTITVAPADQGERVLLAMGAQVVSPTPAVSASVASDLKSKTHAADLLIITHRDFFSALEPLQQWRRSQGYKVDMVDIEAIYNEFSFGNKSPYSVRDFLQYARANWKVAPRYLLLAADASYDSHNYLGFGNWDIVPAKLIDTERMETATDDWFADFNGDGMAEMAVGRLPVRTAQEAARMVAKIIGYERSSPAAEVTLVADANEGFDFELANKQLSALVPGNLKVVEIDRGRLGAPAKTALIDAINRGQKLVNYIGHGNVDQWRASLLTNNDVGLLTNQNHLSVFVMMTCLNAYFADPVAISLAEALMQSDNGGAVAVWASSGMTLPEEQAVMNQEFYRQLFANRGITLGDAIRRAKATVKDSDVRQTWVLLGDPTMRLR